MSEHEEVQATPAAEAKAEELGVDLTGVEPSGASGNVLVSDVEEAAEATGGGEDVARHPGDDDGTTWDG